jgi:L-ascorbate metabolism protein UlaG (beta-lactamase superfamily)
MIRSFLLLLLFVACSGALAHESANLRAHYLANSGVMIAHGETKIVFDPLFRNGFDTYDLVPADMEAALLAGEPPYDGIDAIFISHNHEDHVDPALVLGWLLTNVELELYGPEQAVKVIRQLAGESDDELLHRLHGVALENHGPAVDIKVGPLQIEAIRVPHAGFPERHPTIENIVFRVTLDDSTTVMHFGDATVRDKHFAPQAEHWQERHTHLALPPYWFFDSNSGRQVLEKHIKAGHTIGVHVRTEMPDDPAARPEPFQGFDLFTRPGETRDFTATPTE